MDTHRLVALSGIMVAPSAVGPGTVNVLITPGDGIVEDGSGGSRACACGVRYRLARPCGALGPMRAVA